MSLKLKSLTSEKIHHLIQQQTIGMITLEPQVFQTKRSKPIQVGVLGGRSGIRIGCGSQIGIGVIMASGDTRHDHTNSNLRSTPNTDATAPTKYSNLNRFAAFCLKYLWF